MAKEEGAFLTIGELSSELGVPQHILRYWETRFPQLKPMQRAGNRRYYRPADVELARRINNLLNVEGFTVRGAKLALAAKKAAAKAAPVVEPVAAPVDPVPVAPVAKAASRARAAEPLPLFAAAHSARNAELIARLEEIRARLVSLL